MIAAVGRHFLRSTAAGPVLLIHGGGDGGLFTGILARYLTVAANSPALSIATRSSAADMVHRTADALWAGRAHRRSLIFSSDPAEAAAVSYPPSAAVELSTQLQAWMVLEASAAVRPDGAE